MAGERLLRTECTLKTRRRQLNGTLNGKITYGALVPFLWIVDEVNMGSIRNAIGL
jgi:hypothetical protein